MPSYFVNRAISFDYFVPFLFSHRKPTFCEGSLPNVRNIFEEFDYTAFVLKKQTISLIPVINASRKCKQKLLKLTKTHLKPFKDLNGDKTLPLAAFPVCLQEARMFWLLLVAYQ